MGTYDEVFVIVYEKVVGKTMIVLDLVSINVEALISGLRLRTLTNLG